MHRDRQETHDEYTNGYSIIVNNKRMPLTQKQVHEDQVQLKDIVSKYKEVRVEKNVWIKKKVIE